MSPSAPFRDAAAAAARRRRLASTGRRTVASIRGAHATGELIGIAHAVELLLEIDAGTARARTVRTIEPVPLGLAHLAVPGTEVTVVVDDAALDVPIDVPVDVPVDVMVEWSG